MIARQENPGDLFNSALDSFSAGELEKAVVCLRAAFFENLYIAPNLIGEEFYQQEIWHCGNEAGPDAAAEYSERYGSLWKGSMSTLRFLENVWGDPLVRRELKNYIRLSRALLHAPDEKARDELLDERLRFINRQRIEATQYEILRRLRGNDSGAPVSPPFLSALYLAARDPVESVEFYRKLFNIEPQQTSRRARGCAEFELPGFRLVIHGLDQQSAEDPYELGPRPQSLGWGALFVLAVSDLDRCVENALSNGIELLDSDLEGRKPSSAETGGALPGRFILVKDPSGYLVELEERP
jgi:catechol 2,3-dioxygenase-like lactoylglutathione lyase family enzyme